MTATQFAQQIAKNYSAHQIICELNKATQAFLLNPNEQHYRSCFILSSALLQRNISDKMGDEQGTKMLDDMVKMYRVVTTPANEN